MAVTTISLSSVKNYSDDLTKDKFDSLNFVSFDGGELATVSGNSIYNIILGDNDTAGSLTYRISAAENDILELNNKLGDGFSDTSTVTQQFSTAKERITAAEETAQVAASTLDNFLTVADGKDFLFLLDDLTVPVGRLDKLTDGSYMLSKTKITNWNIHLPLLKTGSHMFESCPLMRWDISLPVLTNGDCMFLSCSSLQSFSSTLPKLTAGGQMFRFCSKLQNFISEFPELIDGNMMFNGCSALQSWNIALPKLKSAYLMFCGCSLDSWDIQLPALIDGTYMYHGCPHLERFIVELPSLKKGNMMFNNCKLDLTSIQNIAEGINDLTSQSLTGVITIGMQASLQYNDALTDEEQPDAVAAKNAITAIVAKGWTVTEQYNS